MPIVRINMKLVYFAHVPKCAGSSVEEYLAARFGQLAFLDRSHLKIPKAHRWNRSSPQHIEAHTLEKLFPASFFEAKFAVVRHPVDRIISVFRYQRDVERTIRATMDFGDWLDGLEEMHTRNPYAIDNHARRMVDLVPREATIFRIEDGTDPIIYWLDRLAGSDDGPREIRLTNTYQQRIILKKHKPRPKPEITESALHRIHDYYAADFSRFAYGVNEPLA